MTRWAWLRLLVLLLGDADELFEHLADGAADAHAPEAGERLGAERRDGDTAVPWHDAYQEAVGVHLHHAVRSVADGKRRARLARSPDGDAHLGREQVVERRKRRGRACLHIGHGDFCNRFPD